MGSGQHQANLRRGRVSLAGHWYALTLCVAGRHPVLVTSPSEPVRTGTGARLVLESLRWMHEHHRWHCRAYCVMPDHVHLVVELCTGWDLSDVVLRFKTFTARRVNKALGRRGPLWQKGFYDHGLRRDEAWEAVARYVLENPVRKGFVPCADEWPWSGMGPPRTAASPTPAQPPV